MRRDLLGAQRRLLDVAGNLLRRRALLFHRGRNGRGYLRQLFDGAADLLDRIHQLLRRRLDIPDLLADVAGRFRGLLRQRLDLGGDDGEAAPRLAGARGLDGGVQGQQISLARDRVDQFDHVADAGRGLRQFPDAVICLAGLIDGAHWPFVPIPGPGG